MRVTTFARIGFGVDCTDEESTKKATKRATGNGYGLRQTRKVAIMPGLFGVLHRTLGSLCFRLQAHPYPATHPRSQSRIHEHGKHCPSAQTCPASGSEASAQREPQVVTAHCAEKSQESHRRRRQGGCDQGIQGAAVGDRPHRRQEGRAQEHGVAKQGAPGASHQGAAIARSSLVTKKAPRGAFFSTVVASTDRRSGLSKSVTARAKLRRRRESGDLVASGKETLD